MKSLPVGNPTRGGRSWIPRFIARLDPQKCTLCGFCLKVCLAGVLRRLPDVASASTPPGILQFQGAFPREGSGGWPPPRNTSQGARPGEGPIIVADPDNCRGCHVCEKTCKAGAISCANREDLP